MKTLLFKTPKGDAFLKVRGELRKIFIKAVKESPNFDCERVKMQGGGFRLKFTCLVDDMSLRDGYDKFVVYLDKGSIIYDF